MPKTGDQETQGDTEGHLQGDVAREFNVSAQEDTLSWQDDTFSWQTEGHLQYSAIQEFWI